MIKFNKTEAKLITGGIDGIDVAVLHRSGWKRGEIGTRTLAAALALRDAGVVGRIDSEPLRNGGRLHRFDLIHPVRPEVAALLA